MTEVCRCSHRVRVAVGIAAVALASACGGWSGTRCAEDQLECDGFCVDPMTDPEHCGTCETACAAAEVCYGGSCAPDCPSALGACEGTCVNYQTDFSHCGGCGNACAPGQACLSGICAANCPPGQTSCGGTCVDLQSDRLHCGGCGDACDPGEVCVAGSCALSCPDGQRECDGGCFDLQSDRLHCGSCDTSCGAGQVCVAGSCAVSCPGEQIICDWSCVDPQTDREHCGATGDCRDATAGVACAAGEVCIAGSCAVSCPTGQLVCDGICHDPSTSGTHCGATGDCLGDNAGTVCVAAAGESCVAGVCTLNCTAEQIVCEGVCHDPLTSPTHCGASGDCLGDHAGAACVGAGETCVDGACAIVCPGRQIVCEGVCHDPWTSLTHCGATGDCLDANAGETCGPGRVCSGGSCIEFDFSAISPGAALRDGERPRDATYVLDAPFPATIHYTTDGSIPALDGSGTTTIAAAPVTLEDVAATTRIRWFAVDAAGVIEPMLHDYTHHASASPPGRGQLAEELDLNGQGPVVTVAPGAAVTGSVRYQVWSDPAGGDCPTCVLALNVGVDGVGSASSCDARVPGAYPGQSGTFSLSFTAPSAPGRYGVWIGHDTDGSCLSVAFGELIGWVHVR